MFWYPVHVMIVTLAIDVETSFLQLIDIQYEGCPSKSWTFVITQDCVPLIL